MFMIVRPTVNKIKPMRMNKSSGQSISASPTKITGMTIDVSYPDSVLVNDGLVMNSNGLIKITGYISLSSAAISRKVYVYKNGVSLGNAASANYSSGVTYSSGNISVIAGDRLELYASSPFSDSVNGGYLYTEVV